MTVLAISVSATILLALVVYCACVFLVILVALIVLDALSSLVNNFAQVSITSLIALASLLGLIFITFSTFRYLLQLPCFPLMVFVALVKKTFLLSRKELWIYNACQKSLEHLGPFFVIRISNHSYQVQIPPRPETMLISTFIAPAFQQSRGSSYHPDFLTTTQHCSKGERGKSQNKAKLAGVFQDFWQAL